MYADFRKATPADTQTLFCNRYALNCTFPIRTPHHHHPTVLIRHTTPHPSRTEPPPSQRSSRPLPIRPSSRPPSPVYLTTPSPPPVSRPSPRVHQTPSPPLPPRTAPPPPLARRRDLRTRPLSAQKMAPAPVPPSFPGSISARTAVGSCQGP
ncbi:hypothetical protein BC936DRAFT_145895 [Jimgerdemannia flammicorona]|uniref:Uncharacterized protein n=1 Tax=Jimgerdemannia flammicorona TaxID=994334 RepID=A0A433D8U2_9FUNG|nr:hypothetical protein BC936DRAFT_145895 [Jimgerdemannia flammicorona]